jgi:hypothetical protein
MRRNTSSRGPKFDTAEDPRCRAHLHPKCCLSCITGSVPCNASTQFRFAVAAGSCFYLDGSRTTANTPSATGTSDLRLVTVGFRTITSAPDHHSIPGDSYTTDATGRCTAIASPGTYTGQYKSVFRAYPECVR